MKAGIVPFAGDMGDAFRGDIAALDWRRLKIRLSLDTSEARLHIAAKRGRVAVVVEPAYERINATRQPD
jgi:hypothetical protein